MSLRRRYLNRLVAKSGAPREVRPLRLKGWRPSDLVHRLQPREGEMQTIHAMRNKLERLRTAFCRFDGPAWLIASCACTRPESTRAGEAGVQIGRRTATLGGLSTALAFGSASAQQDIVFFRIGTGGQIGTYFPVGGLIANAISNPPGSRPCDDGGSCGVPGLVATAVATGGSEANVLALSSGRMPSAFVQSDIAHWAQTGTGLYEGKARVEELRAIANLYPESIHVVTRKSSGIASIADLRGKRVSLDERGSGTLIAARLILAAYGLAPNDVQPDYLKSRAAGEKLQAGQLDAFFSVSGWPEGAIAELAAAADVALVPIAGPEATALTKQYDYFSADEIPAGAYRNVEQTKTLSVNAIWVTTSKQPEKLIYDVTAALWHPRTRRLLDSGHAKGRVIKLDTALQGLGIPLHPGAMKYYRENGLIK